MADINITHAVIFGFVGLLFAVLVLGFHKSPIASKELGNDVMNKTSGKVRASNSVPLKLEDELASYTQTSKY